jgi:hypothetical protein
MAPSNVQRRTKVDFVFMQGAVAPTEGYAEKIVTPAKAGIQYFDFAGFYFWQKRCC